MFYLDAERFVTMNSSFDYIFNSDYSSEGGISMFDRENESYLNSQPIRTKKYASLTDDDGVIRGGCRVDFGPEDLIAQNPATENFYLLWTGSDRIAMVDANFDTLERVTLNLESQPMGTAERDSIREDVGDNYRKSIWKGLSAR